jgi:hypothetical protein
MNESKGRDGFTLEATEKPRALPCSRCKRNDQEDLGPKACRKPVLDACTACMHVDMRLCMSTCACVCMHACRHAPMYVDVCVCMYACMHACVGAMAWRMCHAVGRGSVFVCLFVYFSLSRDLVVSHKSDTRQQIVVFL